MQFDQLKRRQLIALAGAAAAWPLAARAQPATMPVIGMLEPASPDAATPDRLRAFHQGLKTAGFVEGENVTMEYRWAENRVDRLSVLAGELVRRNVAVIAAIGGSTPAAAAKLETNTIPIVFTAAQDPVKLGLVSNLTRPDNNLTGVFLPPESAAQRLVYLRELVPPATRIAVLLDPVNVAYATPTLRDLEAMGRSKGLQIKVLNATTPGEINDAFASLESERPDALFVGPFSTERRVQLAMLAAFHKIPATYPWRDFVDAGGLMSYGAALREAYRQAGILVGSILKGAKPANLPIVQSSRYELIINGSTARMLGLTVPGTLKASADEITQ
jgi:putative ABC transport system substrate-binding protein